MRILVAVKDNKAHYGNSEKIGKLIGMTGAGIRSNIKNGAYLMCKNGFVIYLNAEKL